eukprot:CAMPEP_0119334158 /NCGR_PEP_ID=MMETSP1333-20130426/86726_1 /TAXON_ID=418940 /ORGANISM="Scyphosphaera apsteinii, Strain RCC1455" /LENGTH=166 /DNA_ID=CAMNT_0007344393 /DNA_START=119 /DNA_END=619 /DNA_ORIENTATION=+
MPFHDMAKYAWGLRGSEEASPRTRQYVDVIKGSLDVLPAMRTIRKHSSLVASHATCAQPQPHPARGQSVTMPLAQPKCQQLVTNGATDTWAFRSSGTSAEVADVDAKEIMLRQAGSLPVLHGLRGRKALNHSFHGPAQALKAQPKPCPTSRSDTSLAMSARFGEIY